MLSVHSLFLSLLVCIAQRSLRGQTFQYPGGRENVFLAKSALTSKMKIQTSSHELLVLLLERTRTR